jgi:phosphatidylserine/phosphatidylglycerophosphate/cardiolipin synthase-like enzyme
MGIYPVQETGLLVDACDYFRAFYRSALKARQYILLAGWQFDSEVRLVRGTDAEAASCDVRLIHFLNTLCESTPELEIYVLAWDFSAVFSLEREWFQDVIFGWNTNERLHFRFDSKHALGATHHQKFVIMDGSLAFVGGMDICSNRWDDRYHLNENPERLDVNGNPYGSYHDIQSYHTGPVVQELLELFAERWLDAGADDLSLPMCEIPLRLDSPGAIPLPAKQVAVSRTRASVSDLDPEHVFEIRHLFVDAILAAEQLVYLENQYMSSQAVYWSLIARMAAPDRPRLQIIMVLPDRLPFTEELFLGLPQIKLLRSLQQVAAKTGHGFAVFSTAGMDNGTRKRTFIHSKLLLVDDRFLSVGSANATNRSMALDTELNVSWEACEGEEELVSAIRALRASLLAEHAGLFGQGEDHRFEQVDGLITRLHSLADDPESRLCRYEAEPSLESSELLEALEPIARVVDPEKPIDGEFVFESLSSYETSSFAKGIVRLSRILSE